jgi:Uma2 family endonuclease
VRPDLAIYRADVGTNAMSGDDLLLVVEIMKSSRVRDLERKRPVYAAAGVAEAWFIDMDADTLLVCRDPDRAAEVYRTQVLFGPDEAVSPLRFAGVNLSLNGVRQG